MVTLAPDLRSLPGVGCSLRVLSQRLSHLIGLLVLTDFPNLELMKLNVRKISAKAIYGSYMFEPTYVFLLKLNPLSTKNAGLPLCSRTICSAPNRTPLGTINLRSYLWGLEIIRRTAIVIQTSGPNSGQPIR